MAKWLTIVILSMRRLAVMLIFLWRILILRLLTGEFGQLNK